MTTLDEKQYNKLSITETLNTCLGIGLWSTFSEYTNPDKLEHSSPACLFAVRKRAQRTYHNLCARQTALNRYLL